MMLLEDVYLEFEIIIYHLKSLCQQVIINIFLYAKRPAPYAGLSPFYIDSLLNATSGRFQFCIQLRTAVTMMTSPRISIMIDRTPFNTL